MKEVLFLIVTGFVAVALQITSMGFLMPAAHKPDIAIILVVWASLRTSYPVGSVFAFALGMIVDLTSGSPTGLFAVIYFIVFSAGGYLQSTLRVDHPVGRTTLILVGTLASGCAVLVVRSMTGPPELGWFIARWIIFKALITSLAGLIVFPLLDRTSPDDLKRIPST